MLLDLLLECVLDFFGDGLLGDLGLVGLVKSIDGNGDLSIRLLERAVLKPHEDPDVGDRVVVARFVAVSDDLIGGSFALDPFDLADVIALRRPPLHKGTGADGLASEDPGDLLREDLDVDLLLLLGLPVSELPERSDLRNARLRQRDAVDPQLLTVHDGSRDRVRPVPR